MERNTFGLVSIPRACLRCFSSETGDGSSRSIPLFCLCLTEDHHWQSPSCLVKQAHRVRLPVARLDGTGLVLGPGCFGAGSCEPVSCLRRQAPKRSKISITHFKDFVNRVYGTHSRVTLSSPLNQGIFGKE